jgi:hypothetical protein
VLAEFFVAGESGSEGEEGEEVGSFAFVAQGQAPISAQPGHGSFDDPAVPAEFLVALDALAGDADLDAVVADPGSEFGMVVGLVGMRLAGFPSAWATPGLDRGIAITSGLRATESLVLAAKTAAHDEPTSVYNLTVHDLHTYYVLAGTTSILVHNSDCEDIGSGSNERGRTTLSWQSSATKPEQLFSLSG